MLLLQVMRIFKNITWIIDGIDVDFRKGKTVITKSGEKYGFS